MNKRRKGKEPTPDKKLAGGGDASSIYTVCMSKQVMFHQSVEILGWVPTTQAKPKDDA
jgi:hypothetical protein